MGGKYFLVDTTKCTACRGCQAACKQWNKLPADKARQWGSYQNPRDLGPHDWRLVRFAEHEGGRAGLQWLFFSDACRHCLEPFCKDEADEYVPGAVRIDQQTGAVVFTSESRDLADHFEDVRQACPYNIPRRAKSGDRVFKCHMCLDRVHQGLRPACVAACPTGALSFGDKAEISRLAEQHLDQARQRYGRGEIVDRDDVRVWYLVLYDPGVYGAGDLPID